MAHVYSVGEITGAIKAALEEGFPLVWVRGQVSNLSRPASGHLYFTLKDEQAALGVVLFKTRRRNSGEADPFTGEVFETSMVPDMAATLADGQDVLCAGRINVYPPRGQYQLVAETVQDMGLGRLYLEFEALKKRLAAEGYFALERKRPLPSHPVRTAVVTAPSGAAVRDFLRLASERGFGGEIRIYPSLVQGADASRQIADALDTVNAHGWAEVIVLIRGGGSLEDLWAFNTEPVAEAIHRSGIPVLAGIGHEVDVSIADMVADVRAATPSHAAQMLWPERRVLEQMVDSLETDLSQGWNRFFDGKARELTQLERGLRLLSPQRRLEGWEERFADAARGLRRSVLSFLDGKERAVAKEADALSRCLGPENRAREREVDELARRLPKAAASYVADQEQRLEMAILALKGADPEKPLERGYCMARVRRSGRLLRSVEDTRPGDTLEVTVHDGDVATRVAEIRPKGAYRKEQQLRLTD
jgi:exodeoxyribonuclease VII large subunit